MILPHTMRRCAATPRIRQMGRRCWFVKNYQRHLANMTNAIVIWMISHDDSGRIVQRYAPNHDAIRAESSCDLAEIAMRKHMKSQGVLKKDTITYGIATVIARRCLCIDAEVPQISVSSLSSSPVAAAIASLPTTNFPGNTRSTHDMHNICF